VCLCVWGDTHRPKTALAQLFLDMVFGETVNADLEKKTDEENPLMVGRGKSSCLQKAVVTDCV